MLWNKFKEKLSEDIIYEIRQNYKNNQIQFSNEIFTITLIKIDLILSKYGKTLIDFDLPLPSSSIYLTQHDLSNVLIQEELSQNIPELKNFLNVNISKLNYDQKKAFDQIKNSIDNYKDKNIQKLFFIDGPGGTGKTFIQKLIGICTLKK